MDARSESCLAAVEPDLALILRGAAQLPQPFVVIYGIRSVEAEAAACASGHSQTMHSRHLPDCNKLSAAVDVWALIDGQPDPAKGREKEIFGAIAAQIKASADALGIKGLQWGGDDVGAWTPGVVSHFHDWGHFQLSWELYPGAPLTAALA